MHGQTESPVAVKNIDKSERIAQSVKNSSCIIAIGITVKLHSYAADRCTLCDIILQGHIVEAAMPSVIRIGKRLKAALVPKKP